MTAEMTNLTEQLNLLPGFLSQHVLLSVSALAIGLCISLPLGVLASRWRRLEGVVLGVAGVIQTVPSLALLALMVPLMGMIGWWPALTALVLYSMLPVLRGTVLGLQGVDRAALDAATGLGMTPWQRLIRVELPLAGPSIIGGIRTATVWVVGIATLATPVGQTTLGNFIFAGLQTQNRTAVIVGCIAAAALALLLDGTIRLAEISVRQRNGKLAVVSLAILGGLTLGSAVPMLRDSWTGEMGSNRQLIVGAKTFSEQYVLAELLAQRLEDAGLKVTTRTGLGSQVAFDALKSDAIDCYVDYSGTLWTNVLKQTSFPPRDTLNHELAVELESRFGVKVVGVLGFENTYALAVPKRLADRLGLRTVSDLAAIAGDLAIGGDVEFFARPEWTRARDLYKLNFRNIVGLDSTLMYAAADEGKVDVIAAFSTDGRIASRDLVVLDDDRRAFPPYEATILVSPRAAKDPRVMECLAQLVGTIDTRSIRLANENVDVKKIAPRVAADRLWLSGRLTVSSVGTSIGEPNADPSAAGGPPEADLKAVR